MPDSLSACIDLLSVESLSVEKVSVFRESVESLSIACCKGSRRCPIVGSRGKRWIARQLSSDKSVMAGKVMRK